jgi:hypothetical protein
VSIPREVKIGVRIDMPPKGDGITMFGHEEVNKLISEGWKVESVQAGGVVFNEVGQDEKNVSLVISGCDMKVVLIGPD